MKDLRLIDTHCHPQFPQFDTDRASVVENALAAGVGMFCVGTDVATSRSAIELANEYEGVWASVGIHPNDIGTDLSAEAFDAIEIIANEPKVIAIGEVGLDYYRTTGETKRRVQVSAFERFADMAQRVSKPLIIHCRDAHDDMKRILNTSTGVSGRKRRGIMHSYNGDIDTAFYYIERGFAIGFNAIVTFSPDYHDLIRAIPVGNIVVETDAPYLAPAPYRGKRNEPRYVLEVLAQIAAIRKEKESEFMSKVLANSMEYI